MNWFEGSKNWFQSTENTNWSEITKDLLERIKNVNWSESTKDILESAKNVNWSESAKNVNWSESAKNLLENAKNSNWYESARSLCETSKDLFGVVIGAAKENVEIKHLVIGGAALVLVAAVIRFRGSGRASSNGGKMMKAPGGKGRTMYRDVFEGNPRGYFRGLRCKSTSKSS